MDIHEALYKGTRTEYTVLSVFSDEQKAEALKKGWSEADSFFYDKPKAEAEKPRRKKVETVNA